MTDPPPPAPIDPLALRDDAAVAALLARCTFPALGSAVTLAVSGGPDSSALLVLAVAAGLDVTAVHVDHGLRPGSAAEADVVAALARRLGASSRSVAAPVEPGADLEARARAARHRAVGPDALFGHTADDQAETVLLRLLRGTGPAGLAAMAPARHPLLGLRRSETTALCAGLGIDPIQDPTNASPVHTRNRVRHEVLPLLDDVAGRDVVPLLCRLADLAGEQAALLDLLALDLDPTDARSLAVAAPPVAAAAVRRWWAEVTGIGLPPDAAAVARVIHVASGAAVGCDVVGGWRVRRSAGRLRLVGPVGPDGPPPGEG
ncbi:tRNA lysidine(34) synthetase TilS [Dermatobacter hominis]|uniref:tRNA lysidine(34) synthetase TilS n=1 Tax=Dermatobacter hominis TaxID=2884263 RepID=UPI001D0FE4EE|nr:tRNA lysidine(34) synthetase TilS [Dermatobacter hominis]UDY34441.1 tRNA lysidine(34) synthetase TilS [Dermatobacter hominis]